ncbi:cupin domain-containing protein [Christiangramia sabulilitoris]|uniref:Cupin domain-containing protein n=1 Tax=Christiangramia sabulilitoris TaxID=2583991 RepID=A0A550HZW5_9FLAO|nr:cupin domain-containing protein [Christiangramia sabulilitoris]TRO64235.1 cupin domain-containing protein [Christiangramia sabulilitoris]
MNNVLKMWVLGHKVAPQKISADYDLAIGESQTDVPGPPPHLHEKYHESFYIIEGEMDFIINGKSKKIRTGETVDIPPGTLHTFKNSGSKVCKWVNIHSPKGFSEFFEKYGIAENETEAMTKSVSPEILRQVLETAADYDMKIQMNK